ncbi:glycosyltransferase family 39 protein [bacterium]|nr:glycosyltransferase family 39 protein [bacterium]
MALVFGAFVLRVLFNTYEMPPVYIYPNEVDKRNFTLGIEGRNRFKDLSMPSFLYNTTALIYVPARAAHAIGQKYLPGVRPFSFPLMDYYFWVGRVYMGVCGALGVWLIYLLGKRLGSRRIGLIAALLLAVAPIHVLGSRHMKEDMPLGLFCTGAIVVMLDLIRRRAARDYFRCAFMVGLCMSTKWLGLIMAVPFALAHWLAARRHPNTGHIHSRSWWAALIVGGFAVGFFIASPDYLLRIGDLNNAFGRGIGKAYTAHADGMAVSPMAEALTDYWRNGLWPGLTPALLLLTIIGSFRLWRRHREEAMLILFWVLSFTFLLETARARPYPHYERYLQPVIPCIVALAACGVDALIRLAGRVLQPGAMRSTATAAIVAAAVAWPMHDTIRYLSQIPNSTIIQAYDYINTRVPAGSLIITDGYGPIIDKAKFRPLRYRKKDRLDFSAFPTGPSYVLYSSQGLGRYLEHPEATPEFTRFVHYVLGQGQLVQEWRPRFRSFYAENPTIQLYYFDGRERPFVPKQSAPEPKAEKKS